MIDYIIVAVVVIILASIIARSVVRRKKGITDCGSGCGGCSNSSCGHDLDK